MSKKNKTIFDIAEALGISGSTVSRALQDSPVVKEATREKVKQMAKSMGYQQNTLASGLRKGKSMTIGVIVPLINRHFFSSAISGIEDKARELGYNVIIGQSQERFETEKELLKTFFSAGVDGIIASLTSTTKDLANFKKIRERGTPIVLFDRVFHNPEILSIEGNDYKGGFLATEHLIKQGRTRIAHLGGPLTSRIYQERMRGYRAALDTYKVQHDSNYFVANSLTPADAVDAVRNWWSLDEKPDALFCANDISAMAIMQYLKSIGVTIPQDIAIVGYSNEPSTALITPSLTTVDQLAYPMGRLTMEKMYSLVSSDNWETLTNEHVVMPVELVTRESSVYL